MCGIIGVISSENIGRSRTQLENACNIIEHRGPDDSGHEFFDKAYLGFRRLAIIDITQNGHQPMSDHTGRYWIIFNGEIYNFQSIRQTLVQKGYSFKSSSDTEVLLYAFQQYGPEMLNLLEGMFAFIIYDKQEHSFFAARDRVGKKPLHIYRTNSTTYLFSELKQILGIPGFKNEVNFSAVQNFLTYGAVAQPDTIFQNVAVLPAGHFLTIKDNVLQIKKYWDTTFQIDNTLTYESAREKARYLVEEAVRKRMISDVPLGAFLSGGIDSTIIVGLMRKFAANRLQTFSISYDDSNAAFDESYYQDLVAKKFETEHHKITVGPQDVTNHLDKIIWNMDQPSSDAINTYFVSLSARRGVTVALSGVGADELFAGYSTFKFVNLANRLRKSSVTPGAFKKLLTDVFYDLPLSVSASWKVRGAFALLGAFPRTVDRYNLIKQIYYTEDVADLLNHSAKQTDLKTDVEKYFDEKLTDIQKVSNAEINGYLKNTLLRDSDVMGMAHSLEIRAPFVDHKLIEFTNTLSDDFKIKGMTTKVLLKDAFRDLLPEEVVHRKKMGFSFPLTIWLKKGQLRDIVEDCLSAESVNRRGWLRHAEVTKQKNNFFNLKRETPNSFQSYQRVWMLVVLELWARKFIDKTS